MKKALIALDDTPRGRRAGEYACAIFPHLPECELVLLILTTGVPEQGESAKAPEVHGDEDHHQELLQSEALIDEIAGRLRESGIPKDRLKASLKPIRRGIAQDIVDEAAAEGCDTIILGRSEASRVKEFFHGSISAEVQHKVGDQTVWVVA